VEQDQRSSLFTSVLVKIIVGHKETVNEHYAVNHKVLATLMLR
jgi:hypothetical protein